MASRTIARLSLALAAILPVALATFPHRALLQSCQPNGSIRGKSGSCNPDNDSVCCEDGKGYTTFACSPPVTTRTRATLTLNSFAKGGDGGGASSCTGTFFDDDVKVVALSTGGSTKGSGARIAS
ncbi:unnamed protein product [Miscanthus lutarioriparius]|uniref:Uncharacterized protein n=1 Tax=Miscanthus lutarioriparius TaxID=422564 RepID=A0A811MY99_9POAL|nr:unnamed protein product [Miscanthus lutarioriparius]